MQLVPETHETHEPLDLDKVNEVQGPALAWSEDSALVRFVFGIGKFAEDSGIGRINCLTVLLIFTLAILFSERVMVIPVVHLHGLPGSKKTSLAVAVGWILSGLGLTFSATACPESVSDVETCLINAKGLLVLDEANSLRPLTNLIKSVVTGGELKKRVLYTTATIQHFPIDCSLILPANFDSATDPALIARCLKIDMGDPGADNAGYRSDYHIREEWRREGIRQQCWAELVTRCAAIMRFLAAAADKGEEDLRVQSRMSGFWEFAISISRQEGEETARVVENAMSAITAEHRSSVNTIDDLLPLLQEWLADEPASHGKRFTAGEIGATLLARGTFSDLVRPRTGISHQIRGDVSRQVREILQSAYRLSNRLNGSQEYRRLLGMQVHRGHQGKLFTFDPPSKALQAVVEPKEAK